MLLAPLMQPSTQVLWLQAEHVTDADKRKGPVGDITEKPAFGFSRQASPVAAAGQKLLLETPQGVFKHRLHQPRFGPLTALANRRVLELFGQNDAYGRKLG